MSDAALLLALCSAGTLAIALAAGTGLRAWSEWLALQRSAIEAQNGGGRRKREVSELRQRVRRLEAIANGS